MFNTRFVIFISSLLSLSSAWASTEIQVRQYMDKEAAGWSYKQSDRAFVAESGDCRIQWNAIVFKDGARGLHVRRDCKLPFSEQQPLHRAVLTAIERDTPLRRFQYINWGMFCLRENPHWCEPLARASLSSDDYIDYWRNYPNSRLTEVNSLFVSLANRTRAYQELAGLLKEFAIEIELQQVEKVFSAPLDRSPYHQQLRQESPAGNPRVMFGAGMAYFAIKP